eukprot:3627425-Prymnesium_polylepis.4
MGRGVFAKYLSICQPAAHGVADAEVTPILRLSCGGETGLVYRTVLRNSTSSVSHCPVRSLDVARFVKPCV